MVPPELSGQKVQGMGERGQQSMTNRGKKDISEVNTCIMYQESWAATILGMP